MTVRRLHVAEEATVEVVAGPAWIRAAGDGGSGTG